MTLAVRHWLPEGAFSDEAVKAAVSDCVGGWSRRWFAQGTAVIAAVRRGRDEAIAAPLVRGRVADADLPGPGKRRLLEAALDLELAGKVLGEADHRVLDAVALAAVRDLVARLDETFGKDDAHAGDACVRLTLSLSGSDLLAITLPHHVLVPVLKAQCGAVRAPAGSVRSRSEALAPQRIVAQGLLGRADLALSDVNELAVGDVVVLDKPLGEPVELRLPGGQRIGRGRLGRNGARVSVQL